MNDRHVEEYRHDLINMRGADSKTQFITFKVQNINTDKKLKVNFSVRKLLDRLMDTTSEFKRPHEMFFLILKSLRKEKGKVCYLN